MTTQRTTHPESNISSSRIGSSDGHPVTEAIEAAVPEFKARLRHMVEAGKDRATELKGGIQDGIRERPIQSVLIAAAVGAVVGLLVSRRSR